MHVLLQRFLILLVVCVCFPSNYCFGQQTAIGIFEQSADVGNVLKPGSVEYDAKEKSYTVSGGGDNMWATRDALHFVWKRMSGDVSLASDIRWIGSGGDPHRKACLLIRESLDPDSPYADAVLHGDGLASLQYRETRGGPTREIQSNVTSPRRIRIEKEGDYVFMSIAGENETLRSAGGSFRIKLGDSFLIGLGVCAHDNNRLERAVFSSVEISSAKPIDSTQRTVVESTLERVAIASADRRVVYHAREHIEAPNWSRDGKHLLFNRGGRIFQVAGRRR